VNEGHSSPARQAPVPVVAASALLWIQGATWATLGAVYVVYAPQKKAAAGLVAATLFGFTAVSGTLAVLLPRPGSNRVLLFGARSREQEDRGVRLIADLDLPLVLAAGHGRGAVDGLGELLAADSQAQHHIDLPGARGRVIGGQRDRAW
jgi:hypothetical protein